MLLPGRSEKEAESPSRARSDSQRFGDRAFFVASNDRTASPAVATFPLRFRGVLRVVVRRSEFAAAGAFVRQFQDRAARTIRRGMQAVPQRLSSRRVRGARAR